jgi:hypothetical protein
MKTTIKGAETRLERHVQKWINEQAKGYTDGATGAIHDLMQGGCSSGYASHLIYYRDTVKFFQTHRRDISALLAEMCQNTGQQPSEMFGAAWDKDDPLAQEDSNRNLLAWFGFERAAQILADRNEIEF